MTAAPLRPSVLIADDTPDIRMLLRMSVDQDGSFVVAGEAADGQEAVELSAQLQPDAVLLDLAMPVMDGLQALPLIRQAAPDACIVILSGFNAAQLAEETSALGANGYIEKGSLPGEILATLKGLCGAEAVSPPSWADEPASMVSMEEAEVDRGEQQANLTEMLAVVSHELATPLTAIRGFADTLERDWSNMRPEVVSSCLAAITRNSRHMVNLISNFRDAQKLDLDVLDVQRDECDLVELVRDTVADVELGATQSSRVEIVAPETVRALVDPHRVRQIVANLVGNAFKFAGPDARVEVRVRANDEGVFIDVEDNGPGIPLDRQAELFSKFSRLGSTAKGTGIGLYLSQGLAKAHGGEITVESREGAGACFTVRLPRSSDDPALPRPLAPRGCTVGRRGAREEGS